MFQNRDKAHQTLLSTQNTLVKKKDSEAKLKAQGKADKIAAVQAEIEAVSVGCRLYWSWGIEADEAVEDQ